MIVSHKYRFIFIKSRKVGGTSVEIALSKFLGPEDIVTPIVLEDEKIRTRLGFSGPRNYRAPVQRVVKEALGLSGTGRRYAHDFVRKKEWPMRFYNHIAASQVKAEVGDEIWNSYYKFSIERNSYDKVCSFYFWQRSSCKQPETMSFRDFVLAGNAARASDYNLYSIAQMPAMDRFVRYENMLTELDEVGRHLGLPEPISEILNGIKAKAGIRRKGESISELYDRDTRRAIAVQYAREIRFFDYEFPADVS